MNTKKRSSDIPVRYQNLMEAKPRRFMMRTGVSALLSLLALVSGASAQYWNVSTGDWNTPGNWSPSNLPTSSSIVYVGTYFSYLDSVKTGTANITSADASSSNVTIGFGPGAHGTVNVLNERTWTVPNYIIVGGGGTGTLIIRNNSTVNTNGRTYIGSAISIGGDGSYYGTGTVSVDTGGRLTTSSISMADAGTSTATLNINGTIGSRGVIETGFIYEGSGTGGGHINFAGGVLRATGHQSDFLRDFETGDVQLLTGGAFFDTNGFNVTVVSSLQFQGAGGLTKQGTGTLTLAGDRNYTGDNFVSAGTLANAGGYIAQNIGEIGSMTVTGAGSVWQNSSNLYVGNLGTGELNIEAGSKVTSNNGYIGRLSGSDGTATVTGTDSLWQISEFLSVGSRGTGKLNIEAGGKVTNKDGYIGSGDGGDGTVTVTGVHSLWQNSRELSVGLYGTGELNIEAGGKVTNNEGYIGNGTDGDGIVTVTGADSLWENSGRLIIGNIGGAGKLNIEAGGKVTAPSVILAYSGANGQGTLNLNGTPGSQGMLETAFIYEGTGTGGGKINFDGGVLRATQDRSDFLWEFETGDVQLLTGGLFFDTNGYDIGIRAGSGNETNTLAGVGGLTKQGEGTLTLNTVNTYTGDTTIEAGALIVNGSLSSDVTIKADATLGGTGTVSAVVIESGGTISPGNSPGILYTGTQTWLGGGTYIWDVNAVPGDGLAGTNWDLINVTGDLIFDATGGNPFQIDLISLTETNTAGSLDGFNATEDYLWRILTVSGSIVDFNPLWLSLDASGFENDLLGGAFSVSQSGQSLYLNFTAASVPEPGRVLLLLAGLAALFLPRRR